MGERMDHYPWAWLLYHALDMGVSYRDFWEMSARAICNLMNEMVRSERKAQALREEAQEAMRARKEAAKEGQRLSSLPRA